MSTVPIKVIELRQPGDLGVLRGVILGFSEEARTRGFPSPSLGGFGFVKYENFVKNIVQIGQFSIGRNRYNGRQLT